MRVGLCVIRRAQRWEPYEECLRVHYVLGIMVFLGHTWATVPLFSLEATNKSREM